MIEIDGSYSCLIGVLTRYYRFPIWSAISQSTKGVCSLRDGRLFQGYVYSQEGVEICDVMMKLLLTVERRVDVDD